MVLGGSRHKMKTSSKVTQVRAAAKMAPSTSHSTSERSNTQTQKETLLHAESSGESDIEQFPSQNSPHELVASPVPLKQFERMLQRALKQTSEHITSSLTKEIREIGARTAALEIRVDEVEISAQNNMSEIENLKEENVILQSKLEDFENRDRRSNLRIRGIPESVIDLHSTMTALFQELQPALPIDRLEMDRVHRALMPRKTDGPPRDIIAKFHYYRTKEQLLAAARAKGNLTFQGHDYQLFTDLSQLTIAKRRSMKPQLTVLQSHHITYQWGFPFSIRFTYQGSKFTCRSSEELQRVLQDLRLVDDPHISNSSRRRSTPSTPHSSSQSPEHIENQHAHKRSRLAPPPLDQENSMD